MDDQIIRLVSRLVVPFIQVYGIYIILHGHLFPGGGFAGGAIVGASMILIALSFNLRVGSKMLPSSYAVLLESGGALVFILVGLLAVFMGGNFLANKSAGFGLGTPWELVSGGIIPVIVIAIGVKVASAVMTLFYHLVGGEKAEDGDY